MLQEFITELNSVRTNPSGYVSNLSAMLPNYRADNVYTDKENNTLIRTKEGKTAVDDAITFLKKQKALTPLTFSEEFSRSCKDLTDDTGPKGLTGNKLSDGTLAPNRLNRYGKWSGALSENIIYGNYSPKRALIAFLIDDGNPQRSQRLNIFNPKYNVIGVSCGDHKTFKKIWAVAFCTVFKPTNPNAPSPSQPHASAPTSSAAQSKSSSAAAAPTTTPQSSQPTQSTSSPSKPSNNNSNNNSNSSADQEEEPARASLEESKDGKEFMLRTTDLEVSGIEDLKVFKKRGEIHIIKTKRQDDSEISSDFRYSFPFEFNASTVIAEYDPKTGKVLIRIIKQATVAPGGEIDVGEFVLEKANGPQYEDKVTFDLDDAGDCVRMEIRGSRKWQENVRVVLKEEGYKILVESSHDEEEYDEAENEDVIKTITRREGVRLPMSIGDGRPIKIVRQDPSALELTLGKIVNKSTDDPEQDIPIPLHSV